MKVRKVERKRCQIKALINETSKKYNNFKDFYIKPHDILTDTYEIYLCFDEDTNVVNDKVIQVEVIKKVPYARMQSFIEQINSDFDNLIGIEIIPNKDIKHLAFVILKFEVDREIDRIIPVDVYHMSWSGGSDVGGIEIGMDISRYTYGNPNQLSDGEFREGIIFTSISDGILIRLKHSLDNYDELFKILWDSELKSCRIIEYGLEDMNNWSESRIIVNDEDIKYIDTGKISKYIVRKIEKELGVQVSNRSIKNIQQDIEELC